MTARPSLHDGVSVIVLASDKIDETAATLRSLLGQSETVEIIVACDAAVAAEMQAMWGSRPPDGLVFLTTPLETTSAQRAALACDAARGAFISFAPAGLCVHPRYFALMGAAATSTSLGRGVCLRVDPIRPPSIPGTRAARHEGIRQLLHGSLAVESLLVPTTVLRACGGPDAEAGDAWLVALALRIALEVGLDAVELPEPARPSLPTSSPGTLDASIARWLQGPEVAPAMAASGLLALREATIGDWPLVRGVLDEAIGSRLAGLPLLIGSSSPSLAWRETVLARLPRAMLRRVKRSDKRLALLAKLANDSDRPAYVMLTGDAPPDIDQLVVMCLRMEADGLDACLPFIDDGLLHAPTPGSLLQGTLFRRARLVEVLSAERIQDEHRFWTAFAGKATIGAAGRAAPRRPEPLPELPIDTSMQSAPSIPAARWRPRLFDLVSAGAASLARLCRSGASRVDGFLAAWLPALLRRKPDPVVQLVDAEWYGRRLPGGLPRGVRASDHYRRIGWREGFDPNPFFPTTWYLRNNPDVRQLGICPLEHYVAGGAGEMLTGRAPLPFFDPAWYAGNYGAPSSPAHAPLVDLVLHGARRGRLPHPLFVHEAVGRHLEKVEALGRGEEMRRLWDLREALNQKPQEYMPSHLSLLSTVLLWRSPPGDVPEVTLASEADADPETAIWRLRAVGDTLHLSVGNGRHGHVLFTGASRHRDLICLLEAVGARFDRLAIEQIG